ncbi:pyridoxamine 5'-phosphate oxidase [Oceanibacterium hippocampi]|uniref:Pyridoxine/pyridoxamine 5'-phosphate oxidase n=1 Tax=Oceanibacterium hippocampi TaxID=745714 RepID=A0A1Y5SB80_9PROT|nr:pyridoxamine 5'-phosphate oxidase [Oceanibacterium hippocampi]SLN36010.1 Pyridoxine/pyridoxamine 5'-phosphate oxidase [Oceanibacterium hippocampi]
MTEASTADLSMFDRDPLALFGEWMAAADSAEPNDPNAMALATADPEGRPSVRMVLLKGYDARGFVFFTNLESRKGSQIAGNGWAALCFHWKSLRRQIRIEGQVMPVSSAEADDYFASRPRESRIGAWSSAQSHPMETADALRRAIDANTAKFAGGEVPRPPFWSGFRVAPERIEFWHDRPFRLHDRALYLREGGGYRCQRLYP